MYITIHMIQNHSPANLNRDDLGAPKTCYFGGALRSRISSQCLKRSIRLSSEFRDLLGGIRTRRLADMLVQEIEEADMKSGTRKKAVKVLKKCGFDTKEKAGEEGHDHTEMLIYTTRNAIREMAEILKNANGESDDELAKKFGELIAERTAVPDMALSGRMLEPGKAGKEVWKNRNTTVEAALQVAHALSTHEARPEVDYYVAADDVREHAEDAGAGYVDEAMYNSACFYKYFSINWEQLVGNLQDKKELAAHTVGTFILGAAFANPSGKQNSFAAHNLPDGIVVELRKSPVSYANAFARPVESRGERGVIEQSIAQLGSYMNDLDAGYGGPEHRLWFSPNGRHTLNEGESSFQSEALRSIDDLITTTLTRLGFEWEKVRQVKVDADALKAEL